MRKQERHERSAKDEAAIFRAIWRKLEVMRGAGQNSTSDDQALYQRSTRAPEMAPATATMAIARTYQTATKNGESSGQCVA